jgi:3-oxoacyl-[acyl-carrier protein] reductase
MILIVGGGSGLGKEYADYCKKEGLDFLILSRKVRGEFAEKTWSCNLGDKESIRTVINRLAKLEKKFSSIVFFQRSRHHNSSDQWNEEFSVIVTATREIIINSDLLLSPTGDRSIVAIASTVTQFLSPDAPDSYHVSKSALVQLVRYYARELGPKGIRVNAVSPFTFLKQSNIDFYASSARWKEFVDTQIPLRRACTCLDIIQVINFLLGSNSSYITGQEILVDGGVSISRGLKL